MNDFNPKISMVGTVIFSFIVVLFVIQGIPALLTNGAIAIAGECILGGAVVGFWGVIGIKLFAMYHQDMAQVPKKRATPVKRLPRGD